MNVARLFVVGGVGGAALFVCVDARLFLWRLLLLGGDVEPNPGPLCGVCGGRCTGRGPRCDECGGWLHLKCSGMRRDDFYGREGDASAGWVGRCCRRDGEGSEVVRVTTEVVEERVCGMCGVRMRRSQDGVACARCGVRVHGKCTGVSRWNRTKREEWVCGGCRGGRRGVGGDEGGDRGLVRGGGGDGVDGGR